MTKSNASIHVLADETLGGIKREYVEVDRKAEVDEKIVIVAKNDCEEGYKNGDVFTVDRKYCPVDGDVESDGASSDRNCSGLIYREEYRVLVPVETAAADEPQPADLIDVVSSLATRVADLERENKKLHAALDEDLKIRSENTRRYLALQDEIDTLHKDNRTLGEELARVTKQVGEKTQTNVDALAEAFAALKRAGL
ncbi:hypothetical protein [Bacillus sp. 0102A]|uniref:hypothetical protein n=1 Tax=Bacillus sp. 0102A TaxID=3120563 RepID=UPI002FDB6121